jgi:hypothetical protein
MLTSATLKFLYWLLCSVDIRRFHVLGLLPIPYLAYVLSPCHMTQVQQHFVFALDLKSAYEGEQMIFGLLSLANLA